MPHRAPYVGVRVGNRNRGADRLRERQVARVVDHAGNVLEGHVEFARERGNGGDLVVTALEYRRDPEFAAARRDGRRTATGNHRDTDACALQQLDAESITHVEEL